MLKRNEGFRRGTYTRGILTLHDKHPYKQLNMYSEGFSGIIREYYIYMTIEFIRYIRVYYKEFG